MRTNGRAKVSVRTKGSKMASVSLTGGTPKVYVDAESEVGYTVKRSGRVIEIGFASKGLWGVHSLTRDQASRLGYDLIQESEEIECGAQWRNETVEH